MEDTAKKPVVREVSLDREAMLVVIGLKGDVFLRLRVWTGEKWRFVTPPLPLSAKDLTGLLGIIPEARGVAVELKHLEAVEVVNLLLYHGYLHVHFNGTHRKASGRAFLDALKAVVPPNA